MALPLLANTADQIQIPQRIFLPIPFSLKPSDDVDKITSSTQQVKTLLNTPLIKQKPKSQPQTPRKRTPKQLPVDIAKPDNGAHSNPLVKAQLPSNTLAAEIIPIPNDLAYFYVDKQCLYF